MAGAPRSRAMELYIEIMQTNARARRWRTRACGLCGRFESRDTGVRQFVASIAIRRDQWGWEPAGAVERFFGSAREIVFL